LIYLDTSVVLAHLFAEDRRPPSWIWGETLVSSRLLEYELWTRLHARRADRRRQDAASAVLRHIAFVELAAPVLRRAVEPFPLPVRTLDALHLASIDFLTRSGQLVQLAAYDRRMVALAGALSIQVIELD
jgi:predicted nucleic acid-binding protein